MDWIVYQSVLSEKAGGKRRRGRKKKRKAYFLWVGGMQYMLLCQSTNFSDPAQEREYMSISIWIVGNC